MNFGQLNIHELDKNKSYVCEVKLTKEIAIDKTVAYLKEIKDCF